MTEESTPQITAPVCYRHPERETWVSCTRCERPICPDCMRAASVGFQCPDCVREGARSVRSARTVFGGDMGGERGLVTRVLLATNAALWLLTVLAGVVSGQIPLAWLGRYVVQGDIVLRDAVTGAPVQLVSSPLTDWGAGTPVAIAGGEFHRLVTSGLLHYGIIHLAVNMYALWILGRECERLLGWWRFLALYVLAGVGGTTAVFLLGDPGTRLAGASGSIFGLLAALFFFLRRMKADVRGLVFLLVLNFALGFYIPNISILGHLGGMVVGGAVGAALAYAPAGPRRTPVQVASLVAAGVVLAVLVAVGTAALRSL